VVTRAFVAVRPPDVVLDAIAARVDGLVVPDGKLTPRAQWHLTLQFLGNDVDLGAVEGALHSVAWSAGDVQLSGAGTLPPERRSKYMVLFVREGSEWMRGLAGAVSSALAPLGFVPEARDYTPHLTVARLRSPSRLRGECAQVGAEPIEPAFRVDEFVLYESRLGRGPAEHIPVAKFPLGDP
jgi:2'-5' RNA ligase